MQEETIAEQARRLGISVGTLRARIKRAEDKKALEKTNWVWNKPPSQHIPKKKRKWKPPKP